MLACSLLRIMSWGSGVPTDGHTGYICPASAGTESLLLHNPNTHQAKKKKLNPFKKENKKTFHN